LLQIRHHDQALPKCALVVISIVWPARRQDNHCDSIWLVTFFSVI